MSKKKFDLSQLRLNSDNPYPEREQDFPKFLEKLRKYPHWLELRPIVYDDKDIEDGKFLILGGNKRFKGLLMLDYKEVPLEWVKAASGLTDEEKHEFIIGDNVGFGQWDTDLVLENWGEGMADEWGIDLPMINDIDYSEKNKEIDVDELDDNASIVLNYPLDEFQRVRDSLYQIAQTPEDAVWKLLGFKDE